MVSTKKFSVCDASVTNMRWVLNLVSVFIMVMLVSCGGSKPLQAATASRAAPHERDIMRASFPGFAEYEKKANEWIRAAEDKDLVGQVLMVFVPGIAPNSGAEKILKSIHPGAVLLFAANIAETPVQVREFTDFIRECGLVNGVNPFIAIDHEGGTVYRLKSNATKLPTAFALGERALHMSPFLAPAGNIAELAGGIAGLELARLGLTLNLAPVAESASAKPVLTTRIWSETPETAGLLAGMFLGAHQAAGTACALKHFPGTGSDDPHVKLSSLTNDPNAFYNDFVSPFALAGKRAPAAVLLSLVIAPTLDDMPTVFSERTVTQYLKRQLGYAGFVLTDDLYMKALSGYGTIPERCLKALNAGCDMLMLSGGSYEATVDFLLAALKNGTLKRDRLVDAVRRILVQKFRFSDAELVTFDAEEYQLMLENHRLLLKTAGF